jgi:uncharacterized protein (UPF0335 family)
MRAEFISDKDSDNIRLVAYQCGQDTAAFDALHVPQEGEEAVSNIVGVFILAARNDSGFGIPSVYTSMAAAQAAMRGEYEDVIVNIFGEEDNDYDERETRIEEQSAQIVSPIGSYYWEISASELDTSVLPDCADERKDETRDAERDEKYLELFRIASDIRTQIEAEWGVGEQLRERCVAASKILVMRLRHSGYNAHLIEGYCWYDKNFEGCTDEPCDAHAWVQVFGLEGIDSSVFVDITGDQFNAYLENPMRSVCVGEIPPCMKKTKPTKEWLEQIGWE